MRAGCRSAPRSIRNCRSLARKTLTDGLVKFDEDAWAIAAPVNKIDVAGDWGVKLADIKALNDIGWRLAVVLETADQSARIGFQPAREPGGAIVKERKVGIVSLDGVKWAKAAEGPNRGKTPAKVNQVLNTGDVIYVEPLAQRGRQHRSTVCANCRKSPAPWW